MSLEILKPDGHRKTTMIRTIFSTAAAGVADHGHANQSLSFPRNYRRFPATASTRGYCGIPCDTSTETAKHLEPYFLMRAHNPNFSLSETDYSYPQDNIYARSCAAPANFFTHPAPRNPTECKIYILAFRRRMRCYSVGICIKSHTDIV